MRDDLLLDTNHLAHVVLPVSVVRDRLQRAHLRGVKFGTCIPVLCELEVGIQQTKDIQARRRRLNYFFMKGMLWQLEQPDSRCFGEIFLELQRQGRILSHVDILLAVLARRLRLTILTTDHDFEGLPDIRTENWLTK